MAEEQESAVVPENFEQSLTHWSQQNPLDWTRYTSPLKRSFIPALRPASSLIELCSDQDLDPNASRIPSLSSCTTMSSRNPSQTFPGNPQYTDHPLQETAQGTSWATTDANPYIGLLPVQLPHVDKYAHNQSYMNGFQALHPQSQAPWQYIGDPAASLPAQAANGYAEDAWNDPMASSTFQSPLAYIVPSVHSEYHANMHQIQRLHTQSLPLSVKTNSPTGADDSFNYLSHQLRAGHI